MSAWTVARPPCCLFAVVCLFTLLPAGRAQPVAEDLSGMSLPEDLGCLLGAHSAAWGQAKMRFRSIFNDAGSPFEALPSNNISTTLDTIVADLTTEGALKPGVGEECGAGRLFIHLLSLTMSDSPAVVAQFFQEHEAMASPIMTLLLDVPWVSVALSGWPFFGLMSQIGFHKLSLLGSLLNKDAVDNLEDDITRTFFNELMEAKRQGQMGTMMHASNVYMHQSAKGGNALGTLTALSVQTAMEMDPRKRVEGLQVIQTGFRQALTSFAELDIILTTRWPLWAFLHVGIDSFADVQ